MASDKLFRKPSINVVQGDVLGPMFGVVGANATAAQMVAGRAVCYDANDNEVKECGALDASGNTAVPIGILGYEGSPLAFKPATRDTAYAVGDHVAVHNTPGMRYRGWLATGLTVVPGTLLKTAANGTFTVLTATTDARNAKAIEGLTSSGVTACWMEWVS
jgi:hypothetical protein